MRAWWTLLALGGLAVAGDWRADADAAVAALPAADVARFEAARPLVARDGSLRSFDPALTEEGAVPWLLQQLQDPEVAEALRVSYADALVRRLADVAGPSPWKDAWAALATEAEPASVRRTLVLGLAAADAPTLVAGLSGALRHPDPRTRAIAARAAALSPAGVALGVELMAACGDAAPEVRADAVRALGVLGVGWPAVVAALQDAAPEVRLQALRAAARVDADQAAALARPLLEDADLRVQAEARRVRGNLGR